MLERSAGGLTNYQHRWRAEFIDSLRSVKPEFIIIQETKTLMKPAEEYLQTFPRFEALLQKRYSFDTVVDVWKVYQRISSSEHN